MWIKLKTTQVIDVNGTPTRYHPGDWVDVGTGYARRLISQNLAEKPGVNVLSELVDYTSGMVVIGDELDNNKYRQIQETIPHLEIVYSDDVEIPFSETLIYNTKLNKLRIELLPIGFKWLKSFQVILPLLDYTTLAIHLGNSDDQLKAKEILKELRVPVYDTRLMFVRRCDETKELLSRWKAHKGNFTDDKLAFLCALYEVKPLHLALPNTWSGVLPLR